MNTPHETNTSTETKAPPFGLRLQQLRETLGWERKEVAARLRLKESLIIMMEKDRYPTDLHITFIRGYLRSYGKLLQINEIEINKALEPFKARPSEPTRTPTVIPDPLPQHHHFIQFLTFLIIATLASLVALWWYSHNSLPTTYTNEVMLLKPHSATPILAREPVIASNTLQGPLPSQNRVAKGAAINDNTPPVAVATAQAPKQLEAPVPALEPAEPVLAAEGPIESKKMAPEANEDGDNDIYID